jgi:hypothetical protein
MEFQAKDDWFAGTRLIGGDVLTDSQATFEPAAPILL